MMKFIFGQCLCCLLHHTEVWMTYAKFRQTTDGIVDARNIYMEAIEIIPDVVSLRLALAELEESNGNDESSKIVLKIAYERIPCAFTFSALQRFIRRRDGVTAARKLFSDTLAIRKNPTKEALGLEVMSVYLFIYLSMFQSVDLFIYVSICLSIHLCICLSTYLPIYRSIYLCIYLSIYLSKYISDYLSINLSIWLCMYISNYLPNYLSIYVCNIYLSIDRSMCLSIHLSMLQSIYLSINLSICLSI